MRALVQRVSQAAVRIQGACVGEIREGLAILLGVSEADSEADASYLASKCANLRIFADAEGHMNRSLLETGGEALVISQFTLYGDTRKGRRPSFVKAMRPEHSEPLYELFVRAMQDEGVHVATGRFGADMQVEIHNDGPVTLMVESK